MLISAQYLSLSCDTNTIAKELAVFLISVGSSWSPNWGDFSQCNKHSFSPGRYTYQLIFVYKPVPAYMFI